MKIWLFKLGEALPTDEGSPRLMRTGVIAQILAERGHQVLWWSSTMNHGPKIQRAPKTVKLNVSDNLDIYVLKGRTYTKNISLLRILHHREVLNEFQRLVDSEEKPDIILCCLPILELCEACVAFGIEHDIPVIIDIRDCWPDVIVELAPKWAKFAARLACGGMYRQLGNACRGATAICGVAEGIVDWGVSYAGRERRSEDRSFPLSYQSKTVAEDTMKSAECYWDEALLPKDSNKLVICYFGNFSSRHETDIIIRAFRILPEEVRSRTRIVLCGAGDELQSLKSLADGVPEILFPGWIDLPQIRALMERSSIGLAPYPSSFDLMLTVPNKVVEYFSAGLPVISSLTGELSRLLEKEGAGVTYANGDVDGLARILIALASDPERLRRMGENAARVFLNYRAEVIYADYCDYLEAIADTHKQISEVV